MALSKNEKDELACVYAGLLLWDDKVPITSDKIQKVLTASGNTTVESYYPEFFAKFMAAADMGAFMNNIGGGSGGAVVASTTHVEEKKGDDKKGGKDDKKGDDKKGGKDDKKGGKDDKKAAKKEPEPEPEGEGEAGGFGDLFG
jgi:large subunit ribosomal protein LP1